jgi:aminopeptidase YwaD
LIAAELLGRREPNRPVEILLLNGEDYYAASGQLHYLETVGVSPATVSLAVNVDAVGLRDHRTAFSLYELPSDLEPSVRGALDRRPDLIEGPSWYQSDHMVFVQSGVPAVAVTSERFAEDIAAAVAHTRADTIELVDPAILVHAAEALVAVTEAVAGATVRSQPA